jgi:spore coat protein U-like protein
MMRRLLFWTLLLPLFCAGFGAGARAAPSCLFSSATPMNFGSLYMASGYTFSAVGSVSVLCTGVTGAQVVRVCGKFTQPGERLAAVVDPRSDILFNIFKDPQRSIAFANTDADLTPIDFPATRSTGIFNVYGRIPNAGGDNPTATGLYTANSLAFTIYYAVFSDAASASRASCSSANPFVNSGSYPVSVYANVSSGCAISATPMDFGQQGVITGNVDATSTLTVKCSDTTLSYWVGLDNGVNAQSGQRRMSSGAGTINYNLFQNASRDAAWGATQATAPASATGSRTGTSMTVYGRIPGPVSPAAGTYTDVVTATVHF